MSESKNAKSGAERMRKHREENKLRNELSVAKQHLRRSQILASGTEEADRMKKKAAERKRLQRLRAKEKVAAGGEADGRVSGPGRGMETPGGSSSSSSISSLDFLQT